MKLKETNKGNGALRESRSCAVASAVSYLMGIEAFGRGAQPLPTCGLTGGSRE